MFEDQDMILPDDFQDADLPESDGAIEETPVETDIDTIDSQSTEEETVLEGQEEQDTLSEPEFPSSFKIKFNHEEQEIGYDDAVPLIQKGLNYERLQERLTQLESDPRLTFVEELAQERGISTDELLNQIHQAREQARIDELVQSNIPEEYAQEILENRKFRQQFEEQQKAKEIEEKRSAEYGDFLTYYQNTNGKPFNHQADPIPDEVFIQSQQQGVPLKFAYMEYQNQQLASQLSTLKQNQQNSKKAPIGSLTSHGSTEVASEDDFLIGFNSF